jgi:hypothetical protein
MFTLIGMCASCLLLHGEVADKKLLVQPESRIAVLFVATSLNDVVHSKDSAK